MDRLRVGERIRELRKACGLTQEELAARAQLTKGFISLLERDLTSPSLESLVLILRALDANLSEFFRQEEVKIIFRARERVRAENYPEVGSFELLVPGAQNRQMDPALLRLARGQRTEDRPHGGEEFGLVLRGRVLVHHGRQSYAARRGDCFYFSSNRRHGLSNPFADEATVLWVSAPPSF